MKSLLLPVALLLSSSALLAEESLITPADLPEEAQNVTFEHHMNYNRCMMQTRLQTSATGQNVKQEANSILLGCESHLEELKAHLLSYNVNEPLVIGMTKKMRSRAARELMTKSMNQMAQQAAAVVKAEEIKAEKAQ
jgi:hypothetical protein